MSDRTSWPNKPRPGARRGLGFERSREALGRDWSDFANVLLCLRMRRNQRAFILNQHWARTGNIFPYFCPASTDEFPWSPRRLLSLVHLPGRRIQPEVCQTR
jgi:hypothetical protein